MLCWLVIHSYGGFIISGVTAFLRERRYALVFVDAYVPTRSDQLAQGTVPLDRHRLTAENTVNGLVAPYGFERWIATKKDQDWLRRFAVAHRYRCFNEGVSLTGKEADYAQMLCVLCTAYDPFPSWETPGRALATPSSQCVEMDCLHDAMVDAPEELAQHILSVR